MFDDLVVHLRLVIATLAILNCMCMVSSQDELGQGLAKDCQYKSNQSQIHFSNFLEFVHNVCCFLDYICGGNCINGDSTCECGGTLFGESDNLYCCIPMNETCKSKGIRLNNPD